MARVLTGNCNTMGPKPAAWAPAVAGADSSAASNAGRARIRIPSRGAGAAVANRSGAVFPAAKLVASGEQAKRLRQSSVWPGSDATLRPAPAHAGNSIDETRATRADAAYSAVRSCHLAIANSVARARHSHEQLLAGAAIGRHAGRRRRVPRVVGSRRHGLGRMG